MTLAGRFLPADPASREVHGRVGLNAGEPIAAGDAGPPYPDGLSAREVEVLRLVAMGASNPDVAEQLGIATTTVARHLTHIFEKTGVANRVEATRYAIMRRLTE